MVRKRQLNIFCLPNLTVPKFSFWSYVLKALLRGQPPLQVSWNKTVIIFFLLQSSPHLRELLKRHSASNQQNLLIYLRGVRQTDLEVSRAPLWCSVEKNKGCVIDGSRTVDHLLSTSALDHSSVSILVSSSLNLSLPGYIFFCLSWNVRRKSGLLIRSPRTKSI